MWVFYHDVVSVPADNTSDLATFIFIALITGLVTLAPSFMEKRRNETR